MATAKNIFTPGKIKIAVYVEEQNIEESSIKTIINVIENVTKNESSELFDIHVFCKEYEPKLLTDELIQNYPFLNRYELSSKVTEFDCVLSNILHADIFIATNNLCSFLIAQLSENIVLVPDSFYSTLSRSNKKCPKCFPYTNDGIIDSQHHSKIEKLLSIGAYNPFPSKFLLENKIPLLIYYSDAHKVFYDNHFRPGYNKYLSNDFELIKKTGDQICSVEFRLGGWNAQVKEKVLFLNSVIQGMKDGFMLFSDVDIVVLDNFKDLLIDEIGSYDMIFQNDGNALIKEHNLCTGFYLCKINDRTKCFFENLVDHYDDKLSDQQNMNKFLSTSNIRYKALSKRFFNFSYGNKQLWCPGMEIPFPCFDLSIYHANYTLGNNNKQILLHEFTKWHNETVLPLLENKIFEGDTTLSIEDAIELSNEINKTQFCNLLIFGNNEELELFRFINRNGLTYYLMSLDDDIVPNIPKNIILNIICINFLYSEDSSFLTDLGAKLKDVIDTNTLFYSI